ncbi:MAG: hypothetical protein EOL87_10375 [Spartobacteria bacterium]|nr:hypothetical protein [Spartobacteria bacterium]
MGRTSCDVKDYYPEQVKQLLERVNTEWPADRAICLLGFGESMKWLSRLLNERVAGLYDDRTEFVGFDIAQRRVMSLDDYAVTGDAGLLICPEFLPQIEALLRRVMDRPDLKHAPVIWNIPHAYTPCDDEDWAAPVIQRAALRGTSVNSPDRLYNLMQCVRETQGVDGDIIECGCFAGGTSAVIWETLQAMGDARSLTMFDSFSGFPPHDLGVDKRWNGTFSNVSLAEVRRNFSDCDGVAIVDGNMIETLSAFTGKLSFAHIDVDSYETAASVTPRIWDRLSPGGILLFDDYGFLPNCLPLKIYVDDFFREQTNVFCFFLPSNGYLVKKHH